MATKHHSTTNTAVLEPPAEPTVKHQWLESVPLALLDNDPDNERPDLGIGLQELIDSIRETGLQEPIRCYLVVGPTATRYRLASGHRRAAAARALGWTTIPALVEAEPEPGPGAAVDRLVSNLCRLDIDAISLARGIQQLLAAHPTLTQAKVGAMLGKSQSAIANSLRLLSLPDDVLALIAAGKLTAGHGLELLRITEPELDYNGAPNGQSAANVQSRVAKFAADQGYSVAAVRENVQGWQSGQKYRKQDVERNAKYRAELAARTAAKTGTTPAEPTPEEQAQAAAKVAEAAKEAAANARQADRLKEREAWANRTIDDLLEWHPEGTIAASNNAVNLEVLRIAAVAAVEGARASTYSYLSPISSEEREAFLQEIGEAPAIIDLMGILARIGRRALALDSDKRALGGNWEIRKWVDERLFVSVRIADALRARKLIQANTYTTLTEHKPKPPAEGATPGPVIEGVSAVEPPPVGHVCPECGRELTFVARGKSWQCAACKTLVFPPLPALTLDADLITEKEYVALCSPKKATP